MKKPTMQRIADQLGISKNAVSLALSGRSGVGEALREKIVETAEEMGYSTNKGKFKKESGHLIGLIAREEIFAEHTFFGIINLHLEKEIKSREGNLLLHAVDKESENELILPPFLIHQKVDGLIVLSHLKKEYLQKILDLGIPVVLVDHHHPDLEVDSVLSDNRVGGYHVTKYLFEKGSKTVGFIGQVRKSPSYKERFEGYCDALQEKGVALSTQWINHEDEEEEEQLVAYIQSLSSLPDAWFCGNDHFGFLLSRILTQFGYHIPDQYAVFGFDNSLFSTLCTPKLTTMGIDKEYFAKRSVIQLYNRMRNSSLPLEKILLGTQLILRETTKN
jgi:LacI family transcriptional regulator